MPVGKTLWNCRVPMRDGVEVAVDVVLPSGDGPWPAVVTRTPYMRGRNLRPESWMRLVEHGYAYVVMDMRGRGDSDGEFVPFVHDAEDGHDTIEWIAAQDWCTGKVGMVGGSYEGLTQWWTAKGRPPHLRCIAPMAIGVARRGPRLGWDSGVPVQYWIWWFNLVTGRTQQHSGAPSWEANYDHLPLRTLHEQVGTAHRWWPAYVDGKLDYLSEDFALSEEDWAQLDLPVLIGVGWWDDQSTMDAWMALRGSPGRDEARLLIGAWDHAGNMAPRPVLGGLDVSESVIDTIAYVERFLARHLKDEQPAEQDPVCKVFRTGRMRWESLDAWPAPSATPTGWYLGSSGDARTLDGAGELSAEAPAVEGSDSYTYDPSAPARDFSNLDVFAWSDPPLDSRYLLRRDDALVYVGPELEEAVDVSGQAEFDGYVSIDCPDTDLCVGVYDVHPDGRMLIAGGELGTPGIQRLSQRNGPDPEPLTPGEIYRVRIPMSWLHHTFLPGHRIAVSVMSSAYPSFSLNRNTGEPWPDAIESRPVQVTIHHGAAHPSRLVLPVETEAS